MRGLIVPLEAVVGLAVLLLLLLAGVVARRRWLGRGVGSFDCSLRARTSRPAGTGWALGVARYGPDEIDWFRVFGVSPRASRTLRRRDLEVLERREPSGPEAFAVMAGAIVVVCRYAGQRLELAMSPQAYTGFASWLEAAPPGQNVNVA